MTLLETYQTQYKEFTTIDDFNIEQRVMRVPAEKHFWVARMIDAKRQKIKLNRQKKKLRTALTKGMLEDSPVAIDKKTLDKIENLPEMEDLNEKLEDLDLLIEYLEHVVKSVAFIAQDIKNIIELKHLQSE